MPPKKSSQNKTKCEKPQKRSSKRLAKKQQIQENEVKVQEKTKPIVKARKYKKKSFEELTRINKSKYERIYLLDASRHAQNWNFHVQGQTGNQYMVNISDILNCTCRDFVFRKLPCKHIYFIMTQVAQNEELVEYFKRDRKISQNAYFILDEQLSERLKARMNGTSVDPNDIDLKDDTDCVICFTQMEKETQPLQDCGTCKKYFHVQCITAWKMNNPTCPLCRSDFSAKGGAGQNDALALLRGITM